MDPKERMTCRDALKHPYFEELGEAQEFLKTLDLNGGGQVHVERQESVKPTATNFQVASTLTVPSTA